MYGCPDFWGYDAHTFLKTAGITLVPLLVKNKGIKVKLDFHCNMIKEKQDGPEIKRFQFHSDIELNLEGTDKRDLYEKMIDRIEEKIQHLEDVDSGWSFHSVIKLEIYTVVYKPLKGGSYIKLPKEIATKKAVVNMKNTKDDQCFL